MQLNAQWYGLEPPHYDEQATVAVLKPVDPLPENSRREQCILTEREQLHLELVADGFSATAAARYLVVSEATVRSHRRAIITKLEATGGMPHAVGIGYRMGILPLPEMP